MTIRGAFGEGIRRVNKAPAILAGVLLLTFLVALPLGVTLRGMLGDHLGSSLAARTATSGVNYDWWQEFSAQATGVGSSFAPTIVGFAAVLANLSAMADNRAQAPVVAAAGVAYVLLWILLAGGILDRFARNRPTRASGFFSACGVFFFRFLRLALVALCAYWLLYAYVHAWVFDHLYPWLTRDFTVERNAFVVRSLLYAVFGALLLTCNVVFDYAKIRAVVEDRRSMIGALLAAARFVVRHPGPVAGLYLLNGLAFLLVIVAYAMVAPGAGGPGWSMWAGLLVSEIYLLARLWVKLVFYASQTTLFQGTMAHAEYIAAPQPVWPESPAAEAMGAPPSA
ncbi:MAG: hypothetical protein IMZ44_24450 [Planctomycetes bacterium]|nr:hypothetical protein [Planctomycetota bacterium]